MISDIDKERFRILIQKTLNFFYTEDIPSVHLSEGNKFIRYYLITNGIKKVYCFLHKESGDIYKAESWVKPAKKIRGSIFDHDNGRSILTPSGVKRLGKT